MNKIYSLPSFAQLDAYYILHPNKSIKTETKPENVGNVCLSNIQIDTALALSSDQCSVTSTQGYRTAIASRGVCQGTYYYEVRICYPQDFKYAVEKEKHGDKYDRPQCRVGFCTRYCDVSGPVGMLQKDEKGVELKDQFGYALRSVDCSIVHNGDRLINKRQQIVQITDGDVVGCLIHLPSDSSLPVLKDENELAASIETEKHYVQDNFRKGQEKHRIDQPKLIETFDLEEASFDPDRLMGEPSSSNSSVLSQNLDFDPIIHKKSCIAFFVNHTLVNFVTNVPHVYYYPAVSGYNFVKLNCNFGTKNIKIDKYPHDFHCLPFALIGYKQQHDIWFNQSEEQIALQPLIGYENLSLTTIYQSEEIFEIDTWFKLHENNVDQYQRMVEKSFSNNQKSVESIINFMVDLKKQLPKDHPLSYLDDVMPYINLISSISSHQAAKADLFFYDIMKHHQFYSDQTQVDSLTKKGFEYFPYEYIRTLRIDPNSVMPFNQVVVDSILDEHRFVMQLIEQNRYNVDFHLLLGYVLGERTFRIKPKSKKKLY